MKREPPDMDRPTEDERIRSLSEEMSSDELEEEITRIRGAMDETLTAIERKLDSRELLNQLYDYFASGPGEFGSNLARILKENPVPVVLVALGLAWLGLSGLQQKSRETERIYLEAYEKYARKRKRRQSLKNLSHAVSHFRGNLRRTRKEMTAAVQPERRHSRRRHRSTRRRELADNLRTPLMSSLGAALGAAIGAFPNRR